MSDSGLQISHDFKLSGLKFSNELVLFSFLRQIEGGCDDFALLLAEIAARRINLPFIRYSTPGTCHFFFCVEKPDEAIILQLLAKYPQTDLKVSRTQAVGIITIFPHRSSFRFISAVLAIFAAANFPLYGMGTSVSNLSIATDYRRLDELAAAIQRQFPLPNNHAPFRPMMRIEQIIPEDVTK